MIEIIYTKTFMATFGYCCRAWLKVKLQQSWRISDFSSSTSTSLHFTLCTYFWIKSKLWVIEPLSHYSHFTFMYLIYIYRVRHSLNLYLFPFLFENWTHTSFFLWPCSPPPPKLPLIVMGSIMELISCDFLWLFFLLRLANSNQRTVFTCVCMQLF